MPNPPSPSRWRVLSAEFIKSCFKGGDWPGERLPEIAFAGRSNVGKSSLINCLVGQKRLAVTSSTPGRTRSVNFFRARLSPDPRPEGFAGHACHFVDLPGYGYAHVPVALQRQWRPMVESYLTENPWLRGVFILIDSRRAPGDEERQLCDYLVSLGVPFRVVLTKCDKKGASAGPTRRAAMAELGIPAENQAAPIRFSAETSLGKPQLLEQIADWVAGADKAHDQSPRGPKDAIEPNGQSVR